MSNDDFLHCVFTERHTLYGKPTIASPKIILLAKYWVTKSIFSPAVSQKTKNRVAFFLAALTLNLRHSWKSASARSFGAAYYTTCVIQNVHFDTKVKDRYSFGIIMNVSAKVNFTKINLCRHVHDDAKVNFTRKSVLN